MNGYEEFLTGKIALVEHHGLSDAEAIPLHPSLFPHQQDVTRWALHHGRGLIALSFGLGKCHGAGTAILMADGTTKLVEDIRVGERLMGDDGTPRTVLSLARGREAMYRITLRNGDSYTCNESHMLSLRVSNKFRGSKKGDIVAMSLRDYLALPGYAQLNCFKHYKVALPFGDLDVPFDPYLYGAWLGDGTCGSLEWTINDQDTAIVDRIIDFAQAEGLHLRTALGSGCTTYSLSRMIRGKAPHIPAFYFVQGSALDGVKRIDRRYLLNSREVRLQLLAGIVDTDGSLIDKCFEISTKWEGLRDDILFLCRSLGLSVAYGPKIVDGQVYHRIWVSGDTHLVPCITRKKAGERRQIKNPLVYGFDVEPLGVGDYYGFELDGNHLYLLADFTVTHNTRIQCELAKAIVAKTGRSFLLVCPLGVKHQFELEDGPALDVAWQYVRTDDELRAATTPYLITNYERVRDGAINPQQHDLGGVSLDEGSVLRNLGSKTYGVFELAFRHVDYRFVCTATPAPNAYRELIYYGQFLGVMDSGQALTRWFKRNPLKAGDLTLHEHHEKDFWLWVASWALFLFRPGDLGHDDTGYDLPPLRVHYHRLAVDHTRAWDQTDKRGQHQLLLDSAGSLPAAAREKRASIDDRLAKAQEILAAEPAAHWLIWHHLEDERKAIEAAIPTAVTVYGSQKLELREQRIVDFSRGDIPILATKPEIAGSGCNFQRHCSRNLFLGVDYRFEDFIQAVHRTYRFQQGQPVDIHIIYTESEDGIVAAFKKKWEQHDQLVATMREIIQRYGLSHQAMRRDLSRRIGVARQEVRGERFVSVHNDCVAELPRIADNSVGMILTSIPFGNQYEYSTQYEDFGHNSDDEAFLQQMDFLIPELLRVLKPGRIAAIHVKDRILYGHATESGFLELNPFSDKVTARMRQHGFMLQARRIIMTDVVRENNQTYRLGWSECCKDSTKMGCGSPEYLLTFRKPPSSTAQQYADEPVTRRKEDYTRGQWQIDAAALWRSGGQRLSTPAELAEMLPTDVMALWHAEQLVAPYDYDRHLAISAALEGRDKLPAQFMLLPPKVTRHDGDLVWDDIAYIRTLNAEQARRNVEQHLCPLPLDIVERALRLYSQPDDLVLDPFGGLHTVPYAALKMGRRAYGIELHEPYWRDGVRYCQHAEREAMAPTLFDLLPKAA